MRALEQRKVELSAGLMRERENKRFWDDTPLSHDPDDRVTIRYFRRAHETNVAEIQQELKEINAIIERCSQI